MFQPEFVIVSVSEYIWKGKRKCFIGKWINSRKQQRHSNSRLTRLNGGGQYKCMREEREGEDNEREKDRD